MLPASNRGPGMALNFPDVCKVPAPPAPFIPAPFPDIGMNMQAAPFSPFTFVQFVPATNMASVKVMTTGDEAGSLGGLFTGIIKGPGTLMMGNPIVFITGLPGENLALPTTGNAMNAPLGAQVVPSTVNVLYTYLPSEEAVSGSAQTESLTAEDVNALLDVAHGGGDAEPAANVRASWLDEGVAYVRIGLFTSHTDRETFNALRHLGIDDIDALVLDLRHNPGGDTEGALRLLADFLGHGVTVLRHEDGQGERRDVKTRGEQAYRFPLCLLIDEQTASAAELFAAALQHHGRATIVGRGSYGKASAQRALRWPDGTLRYTTVGRYVRPDGTEIEGRGVRPDVLVSADVTTASALVAGLAALRPR